VVPFHDIGISVYLLFPFASHHCFSQCPSVAWRSAGMDSMDRCTRTSLLRLLAPLCEAGLMGAEATWNGEDNARLLQLG